MVAAAVPRKLRRCWSISSGFLVVSIGVSPRVGVDLPQQD
jgi:hypothetical protein